MNAFEKPEVENGVISVVSGTTSHGSVAGALTDFLVGTCLDQTNLPCLIRSPSVLIEGFFSANSTKLDLNLFNDTLLLCVLSIAAQLRQQMREELS